MVLRVLLICMDKLGRTIELNLLENSHRFLREAVTRAQQASEEPDAWLFAVSALVQSVELALKAALAKIHPVLIYENIDKPARSVSIRQATQRLQSAKIGNLDFSDRDLTRLLRASKIRNELTHSAFSISAAQIEANFHEVFAFLAEFNRRLFSINMDDLIDSAYLVEFLANRKHHEEMLARAKNRINDEGIDASAISNCSQCTELTFVKQEDCYRCYLCHAEEPTLECQRCGNHFLEDEFEDFFDAFDGSMDEGRYVVYNDYGYSFHTACSQCASEIRLDIEDQASQLHYEQMMEEYYMDQRGH